MRLSGRMQGVHADDPLLTLPDRLVVPQIASGAPLPTCVDPEVYERR